MPMTRGKHHYRALQFSCRAKQSCFRVRTEKSDVSIKAFSRKRCSESKKGRSSTVSAKKSRFCPRFSELGKTGQKPIFGSQKREEMHSLPYFPVLPKKLNRFFRFSHILLENNSSLLYRETVESL